MNLISEGSAVNALLVFVPLLIRIAVAVRRALNPFLALLGAGGVHGLCLALVHNVLWTRTWDGDPPRLGGNLAGRLSPGVEELLLRGAMSATSIFSGLAVGAVCGAAAWALRKLLHHRRPD